MPTATAASAASAGRHRVRQASVVNPCDRKGSPPVGMHSCENGHSVRRTSHSSALSANPTSVTTLSRSTAAPSLFPSVDCRTPRHSSQAARLPRSLSLRRGLGLNAERHGGDWAELGGPSERRLWCEKDPPLLARPAARRGEVVERDALPLPIITHIMYARRTCVRPRLCSPARDELHREDARAGRALA